MKLDRRFFLRGTCQGALAVMGLPFLDCFLNSKGQAQTSGRPQPQKKVLKRVGSGRPLV